MRTFLSVLTFFVASSAFAEITILDVRRNIPLSDDEPVYTDYYLSAGENEGLKKNEVVTVFRSTNIRDNSGAQSYGEIPIPVAQIRILAVYPKLAVAREFKPLTRDENPMLEQTGIMSGDKISTKDSFIDNSKPKRKPQAVAAAPVPAPVPTIAAAVVVTPMAKPTPATPPAPTAATPTTAAPVGEVKKSAENNSIPDALLTPPVNNSAEPKAPASTLN